MEWRPSFNDLAAFSRDRMASTSTAASFEPPFRGRSQSSAGAPSGSTPHGAASLNTAASCNGSARRIHHKKSASDTFAFAAGSFLQQHQGPEDLFSFLGPETGTLLDEYPLVPDELLDLLEDENNGEDNCDDNADKETDMDGSPPEGDSDSSRRASKSASRRRTGFSKALINSDKPAPNFAIQTRANAFDPAQLDPKRAKRIIANRQSAHRSRMKKLQYIHQLEKEIEALNETKNNSQEEADKLVVTNRELLQTAEVYRHKVLQLQNQLCCQAALKHALQQQLTQLADAGGQHPRHGMAPLGLPHSGLPPASAPLLKVEPGLPCDEPQELMLEMDNNNMMSSAQLSGGGLAMHQFGTGPVLPQHLRGGGINHHATVQPTPVGIGSNSNPSGSPVLVEAPVPLATTRMGSMPPLVLLPLTSTAMESSPMPSPCLDQLADSMRIGDSFQLVTGDQLEDDLLRADSHFLSTLSPNTTVSMNIASFGDSRGQMVEQ